jgi:hypothetical protein
MVFFVCYTADSERYRVNTAPAEEAGAALPIRPLQVVIAISQEFPYVIHT